MIQNIGNLNIIFYIFASIAAISSCMVILSKNPVRAVLFLIGTFFATAVSWLILEAEFLALLLVIVYVGAVMVLFLFIIMMLDIDFVSIKERFAKHLPIAICIPILLLILIVSAILPKNIKKIEILPRIEKGNNIQLLAEVLYSNYLVEIQIAGVLLLVAIVAAVGLAFRGAKNRKVQNISEQINVNTKSRISVIDLKQDDEI